MPYTPMSNVQPKEVTQGAGVLPAGKYVCIITDARYTKSKKGHGALVLYWDVAQGEHAGHFSASQYPPQEWFMLEGDEPIFSERIAPFVRYRLDCISKSNSVPPVTFDASAACDEGAIEYFNRGKIGELPAQKFVGQTFGAVIGIEDYTSTKTGETKQRNYIVVWYPVNEILTGQHTDSSGKVLDIKVPEKHKDSTTKQQQATAPAPNMPPQPPHSFAAPQAPSMPAAPITAMPQNPATMSYMQQLAYGQPQPIPAPQADLYASDVPF